MKLLLSASIFTLAGLLSFPTYAYENAIRVSIDDIPENSDSEMIVEGNSVLILDEQKRQVAYSEERLVANVLREITPSKRGFHMDVTAGGELWLAASTDNNDSSIMRSSSLTCYTCMKQAPGQAYKVAGGRKGEAYHLNTKGELWRGNESGWAKVYGNAVDIAAGPDGEFWHLGREKNYRDNHDIFRWDNGKWNKVTGNGTSVALGNRIAYVSNDIGEIYSSTNKGGSWKKLNLSGVKFVDADPEGRVYVLMDDQNNDGYLVKYSDDKGASWNTVYAIDGYKNSNEVRPLRAWELAAFGDNIWFNRGGTLLGGKISEMTVNNQNIVMEVVSSRAPIEPYRFEEGPLAFLNCTPNDVAIEVFNGNDSARTVPARKDRLPKSKLKEGLSCGTDYCWIELDRHESNAVRIRSGKYVVSRSHSGLPAGGDLMLIKTNHEALSQGCGFFNAL